MSDREDLAKGDSDTPSETCITSSDSAAVLPDTSVEIDSSVKQGSESVVPITADASGQSVCDTNDSSAMGAVSDVDDPPVAEDVSDADDPPVAEDVSDADDPPVAEGVSDADDPPVIESVSDTDDPLVTEGVSDSDEMLLMEAVSDTDDQPAVDAVSDVDAMEVGSDADDPSEKDDGSDADDLPTVEMSDIDDSPAMEAVSDEDRSAVSSITNASNMPPSTDVKKATSGDVKSGLDDACPSRVAESESSNLPGNTEDDGVNEKSVDSDGSKREREPETPHSESVQSSETSGSANQKTSPPLSTLPTESKDSQLKTEEGSDADLHSKGSNEEKNVESREEKDGDNAKQQSSSSKTSAAVPNVKAEFSDNEENVQLSPQNKLLEVIFKEQEEDEDNMAAFIPEVECTIEDTEGNSSGLLASQEKGDSENTAAAENSTVGKDEIVNESVTASETSINNENKENGACEDSYVDATGSYAAESCDVDETMQTYAKEFLYSDTSSLGPEPDAAGTEDGKRTTLNRFPNIIRTVSAAEYSLLQEMYKLLYFRNPWDTKEVLSARILDFSGFHFAQDSEDYFNREVTLRGMPQKTLEAIAHLLCLARPISARSNKQRINLALRIMKFLMNPVKPKRSKPASSASKSKTAPVKSVTTLGEGSSPDIVNKAKPNKSRKSTPIRAASKSCKKEAEVKVKLEKESTSIPVTERNISPGKMKWSDLALPEVKVELTKMKPSEMCKAAKLKLCTPIDENSDSNSKSSKPSDADEATDTEDNATASVSEEEIKKLKEFPEVLSNIEGTPEKILSDIHYLLYLEDASLKDLKSNVMEFRGFPIEDGPSEVDERKQFLEKMSDDIIKNIADTFYLKSTNKKEDNVNLIIKFLKAPSKCYMKEAAEAPDKMLTERNTDLMDGLSDSDDSITCEIVQKKVDCIDLMSSGEEDEKEEEKEQKVTIKKEELPGRPEKRCLHDFETITKIVNTHPHEYLIDIYNLLYQRTCEPSTLRKEILEFTGFAFEKGADEYVKRKQYLDRMQYNNVRRIFNTLIHNTRDVRVFSKPTMIGEIFQFLFKLPDTDTSIRPPPQKSNAAVPVLPKEKEKVANPSLMNVVNKADPPQTPNNTRLSELKRVFQRVACFPCEYLVDVHKLLFMKDCDMKDIRQNIFAFKGFPFGVESQEFKQRKMYLEYLTFHSLRKISSVLTTKNVDLRNSTKHELSTHLTKVLTEYTNTYMEAEAQEASSQAEEITAQANKAAAAAAKDPNVEKIVVTPVIEGFQAATTNDTSLPKVVDIRSQSKETTPKPKTSSAATGSIVVTSTTTSKPSASPQRKKVKKSSGTERPITQTFEKIIIPTVDQPAKQRRRKKANPTQRVSEADALAKAEQMNAAMQFQDIHLPEVESLVRSYQQNPSLMSLISRPQTTHIQSQPQTVPTSLGPSDNIRANYRTVIEQKSGGHPIRSPIGTSQFPLQVLYPKSGGHSIRSPIGTSQFPLQVLYPQQVRQAVPPPNVTVGLPPRPPVPFQIIRPFSMQPNVQNLYYNSSILNSSSPPLEPIYKDDEPGDFAGALPVECILTEGGSSEPAAKKPKLAQLLTAPQGSITRNIPQPTQPVQPIKKPFEKHIIESCENVPKPSASFHLKIRDAMTKAAEDEEDCDKPLASLVGHPNDKVLKQQICEIVENTDLQDITINGVIQKIFNMYPKFNLNYRKEFIKSTLRSLLYRLGEQEASRSSETDANNPDSSVSASSQGGSPKSQMSPPTKVTLTWGSSSGLHKS